MKHWLSDPVAGSRADRREVLFLAALGLTGFAVWLAGMIMASEPPSRCHEDEALIWIDAPDRAACVPLDDLRLVQP